MKTTTAPRTTRPLDPSFGDIIEREGDAGLLDLDRDWLIGRFRERGCLLFRGFRASTEDFERISDSLGRDFMTYQGGGLRFGPLDRKALNPQRTLLTATGNTQDFPVPMHGEMYYMARQPEMIWFYCARTTSEGGETTVADGRAVLEGFSDGTGRFLAERRIQYVRELEDGEWQVAFLTEDRDEVGRVCGENATSVAWGVDGSLTTRYECSAVVDHPRRGKLFLNTILPVACGEIAIRRGILPGLPSKDGRTRCPMLVRLDDGEPIPQAILEEMLEVSGEASHRVRWEDGDLMLVDNTWLLHGRRGSSGADRAIYVRMCAFGFPIQA